MVGYVNDAFAFYIYFFYFHYIRGIIKSNNMVMMENNKGEC